ncbi:MAG: MFS transporter, partial [Pedobacter sp.]|nr:MFS transporter [Pedobacter sp.]
MNITTFNSFKSRNYRLFFAGQSVSLVGTWMQKTAVSWIIYSITGSKFMLGVSVFATLFPTAIFSLYGGIIADRYNRYRVLLITQIISLLQAVLLTLAIIFFRQDAVWWIIGLSVMLGIINGFDVPARQSLVRQMVDKDEDLPNALALNSSMVNLSKLIGPALAGFILEGFGEQICFGINAVSFIAVIVSLLFMRLDKSRTKPNTKRNLRKEFSEAYQYIKNTATISSVIIFAAVINLFALPFSTLTPVFAKDVFHGTASTFGVIDGFVGLGAFAGALYLASLKKGTDLSRILATGTFIFGTGLMLFSYTTFYPLALAFLVFSAFG